MKRSRKESAVILAISLSLFAIFSLSGYAQATAPAAAPAPQATAPVLLAKIATNFSTKNAKVGDLITAKTIRAAKATDGADIPKGSKLVAKVTSVQSKKAGDGNSVVSFRFDEVDVKGSAAVPIHGMVVAIGPGLGPKGGLGQGNVLGRNGVGSSPGVDPNTGLGKAGAKDEDDIPLGSTLEGVALGRHTTDTDWTTALQGVHTDIDLDSDVLIKVRLQ